MSDIQMVAVDMDGTFLRTDKSFDENRFKAILRRMLDQGAQFVVASGNQYWQLRDFFPAYDEELSFVAENGAYVKDHDEVIYQGAMDNAEAHATLDWIEAQQGMINIMSCEKCAYAARGSMPEHVFKIMQTYYHRLEWVDDLRRIEDPILKFALAVPEEQTMEYFERIRRELPHGVVATTSGHGAIDLIKRGVNKANGLMRLTQRWGIDPSRCAAFGDGGNDIEMLRFVGHPYAMENASDDVKRVGSACPSNDEDGVLQVMEQLFL